MENNELNSAQEALVAFNNKNFVAAYNMFSNISLDNGTNWKVEYYKGLSAGYLTDFGNIHMEDFIKSFTKVRAMNGIDNNAKVEIFNTSFAFVSDTFVKYKLEKDFIYQTAKMAQEHFEILRGLVQIGVMVNDFIDDKTIINTEGLEAAKKLFIDKVLEICAASQNQITYLVGYKNVKEKDVIVQVPVQDKFVSIYSKETMESAINLRNSYNNLPGTIGKIKAYDYEIESLKAKIQDYETALDTYFTTNPDEEKAYKHPGLFGAKKKKAEIEEKFPPELLDKMKESEQCEIRIEELINDKKDFIAHNTKQ